MTVTGQNALKVWSVKKRTVKKMEAAQELLELLEVSKRRRQAVHKHMKDHKQVTHAHRIMCNPWGKTHRRNAGHFIKHYDFHKLGSI